MAAQPCVIVGRDVFLYTATGYGHECSPTADTLGALELISRWRTAQFEWDFNWAETTSSSNPYVTRRRTTIDFRATLEGLVTMVGSSFMILTEGNNVVKVVFQEANSGNVFTMFAGIVRGSYRAQRDQFEDTLELQCVGDIMGDGSPFTYLPATGMSARKEPAKAGWAEAIALAEEHEKRSEKLKSGKAA